MRTSSIFDNEKTESCTDYLIDRDCGFYHEAYFRETLCLERKRRERSRRPMLVALLDCSRIKDRERGELCRKISRSLFSGTRETDIKGWYSEPGIIGVIFTEGTVFDKHLMGEKIRALLAAALPEEHRGEIGISLHIFPDRDGDGSQPNLPINPVLYPDVMGQPPLKRSGLSTKRALDIAGSLFGLALFSPFFVVLPALIKATSKGPALFRQERIGLHGRKFTFFKFRSMYVNNDSSIHREYVKKLIAGAVEKKEPGSGAPPVYKILNDKRITRIGRLLRKTSLDEIPQFFNVLRGDMSLVGPRPCIEYEAANYDLWHRRRVIETKPGITGLWQVKGRSSTTFDDMVRLDIRYSREWSIWLDLKILWMTPWAMIRGTGAH